MKSVYDQIVDIIDDLNNDLNKLSELQEFQERCFRLSPLKYWKLCCDVCKEKITKLKTVADKYVTGDLLPPTTVKMLNRYQEAFSFAEKRFIVHSNNSAIN